MNEFVISVLVLAITVLIGLCLFIILALAVIFLVMFAIVGIRETWHDLFGKEKRHV